MRNLLKNNKSKIGVYVAHDDDAILGVGGRIIQHIKNREMVFIVIFTDGRHSHKAVLGIEENPTVWEVKAKRAEEIKGAMMILGVPQKNLYFFELTDGDGMNWQSKESTKKQIMEITNKEKPDLVYFNCSDAHVDHRAVNKIMSEILKDRKLKAEAYQFFIWTKELAEGRPEVDVSQVSEMPPDALRIDIKAELELKRRALFEMKSQVNVWPYSDWQVQEKPILDQKFIDYFLREEEIFTKFNSIKENK